MDRPSFRRMVRPEPPRQRLAVMAVLLLVCGGLLLGRSWLLSQPEAAVHEVVEVRGEVPHPGFYSVVPPVTVADALLAAGAHSADERLVAPGSVVTVRAGGVELGQMDKRLVFGLPISVNTGSIEALRTVPGIGPSRAEAIVQARTTAGPFSSVDDLTRIKGFGPKTIERIRPFVSVD